MLLSRKENLPLLLIEDNAAVRRGLQLLLQGKGYQVHSFANAVTALADPASVETAHVVVEYSMPDCDGIAALQTLRARGWQGIAILITAFFSEALQAEAVLAGFAAVLPKPFRDDSLLDVLAKAVPIEAESQVQVAETS